MNIIDISNVIEYKLQKSLNKYSLYFIDSNKNEIKLQNQKIIIVITYFLDDYTFCIQNNKSIKCLNEFVFQKYPDYVNLIKHNKEIDLFKKSKSDFSDFGSYLSYLIEISFQFLEDNYPETFNGELYTN